MGAANMRISVLGRPFGVDRIHPLVPGHPNFNKVRDVIGNLIVLPKQLYQGQRDQWSFSGHALAWPSTLKPSRGGASWVLPMDPTGPGRIGFVVTPLDWEGQPMRLKTCRTQVRSQALLFVPPEDRQMVREVIARVFERTYATTILQVTDHPKFGTNENGFYNADHCWLYVETTAPLSYRPAFVTPDDLWDERLNYLLGLTLWQEPVIGYDLVAPHRGCGFCHELGHVHKVCDALKQHRWWLRHRDQPHPLVPEIQAAVRAEREEAAAAVTAAEAAAARPRPTPMVRFVPVLESDAERDRDPDTDSAPAPGAAPRRQITPKASVKWTRQKYTVPDGLHPEVYDALQYAYTRVGHPTDLRGAAEAAIRTMTQHGIFPPPSDSVGGGISRQADALAMVIKVELTMNGRGYPSRTPTYMEKYFKTLFWKNPPRPTSTAPVADTRNQTGDEQPNPTTVNERPNPPMENGSPSMALPPVTHQPSIVTRQPAIPTSAAAANIRQDARPLSAEGNPIYQRRSDKATSMTKPATRQNPWSNVVSPIGKKPRNEHRSEDNGSLPTSAEDPSSLPRDSQLNQGDTQQSMDTTETLPTSTSPANPISTQAERTMDTSGTQATSTNTTNPPAASALFPSDDMDVDTSARDGSSLL